MGNKLLIMEIARKVREVELWEVFSQLKEQKGVSIADIANATGLPYTTVDSIIKKKLKDIKYSNAQKIADYFGVSVEYLATGKKPDNVIEYDHNKLVYVPVVGESAAGYPIYADQQFEGMFPVDTRFVNLNGYNKDDFFYLLIRRLKVRFLHGPPSEPYSLRTLEGFYFSVFSYNLLKQVANRWQGEIDKYFFDYF
jgi:transcriptional regulator with XRE-family HTH domain